MVLEEFKPGGQLSNYNTDGVSIRGRKGKNGDFLPPLIAGRFIAEAFAMKSSHEKGPGQPCRRSRKPGPPHVHSYVQMRSRQKASW